MKKSTMVKCLIVFFILFTIAWFGLRSFETKVEQVPDYSSSMKMTSIQPMHSTGYQPGEMKSGEEDIIGAYPYIMIIMIICASVYMKYFHKDPEPNKEQK